MRTKLGKTLKQVAVGGLLAAVATSGYAANQGSTGFTSTGDLAISLTVNNEVRINQLADITLPDFSGSDVSDTSVACVYRNGLSGDYSITATGSGTGNAFTLTDTTDTVAYDVEFDDRSGSGFSGLASGVASNRTNAESADNSCAGVGGSNADIRVTVTAANAASLPASTYTGTLTLVVAPI